MNPDTQRGPASRKNRLLLACFGLVALVSLLVYAPSLRYGFVWDDEYFVVRNRALRSWQSVPRYFTDVRTYAEGIQAPMYRPLRNISYLVDYKIAGISASWFHAHNILLHAVNACLVFWLLLHLHGAVCSRQNGDSSRSETLAAPRASGTILCCLMALLWAAHPAATEAVAWIKSRDELLFSTFYLVAVILLVTGLCRQRLSPGRIAAVSCLYALSLLSKEMAVSFPLMAWLLCALLGAGTPRRNKVLAIACLVLVTVAFVVIRHLVIGKTQQQGYIAGSFYSEMLTMTRAAARYVRLAVFPAGLLADYRAFGVSRSPGEWRVVLSCTLILALLVACVGARRRLPALCLGIAWFGIALLPVSNVVSTMQFLADRFLYLPLVGLAILLTNLLSRLEKPVPLESNAENDGPAATNLRNAAVPLTIATLLLAMAIGATSLRLPVWRSNLALYERTYLDSPPSGRIAHNYASALANSGQFDKALPLYRRLVESGDPALADADRARIEEGYGLSLMSTGSPDEGLSHSLAALALRPENPDVLGHIGFYYGSKGDHRKAFEYYDRSFRINPSNPQVRRNRELALTSLKAGGSDALTTGPLPAEPTTADTAGTSSTAAR
jgi:protein O-mannosyl-transferase